MPANRSRTQQWRSCLHQIAQRNGAIEIAISRHYDRGESHNDLMWRVRLLQVGDSEMLVEQPVSMGQPIEIAKGIDLTAIMAIGQNRWMFNTTNLGRVDHRLSARMSVVALRLLIPDSVQRCQRREYYRFDTAAVNLPEVEMWPLLDPASVVLAERANEVGIGVLDEPCAASEGTKARRHGGTKGAEPDDHSVPSCLRASVPHVVPPALDLMPNVGPRFTATMMNVGGGGVGVRIDPKDSASLSGGKLYWLRLSLPDSGVPICASARLVHTHIDSTQATYAGLSFDFSFNPAHQRFVVDQICRYIAHQQRMQLQRQATQDLRQSA